MGNLAVSKTDVLNIDKFNINSFFYTDSILHRKLTINEESKTIIEYIFAAILLVLLLPVFILVAISIKISMGGDVFYSQTRVGKNGKNFKIFKFRTMVADAESKTGPILAQKNDPRITKLGNFLRASHIDELPQLLNIITGDMSFVGPRPERPEFVSIYEIEIQDYIRRREVKPGITGLAQICLPYDATANTKIQYDTYYIDNRSSVILNVLISYYTAMKMVAFQKYKS